jgi:hypothetical protein
VPNPPKAGNPAHAPILAATTPEAWAPAKGAPGYLISADGQRLARLVAVRSNKDGSRYARVSVKGRQQVIRW